MTQEQFLKMKADFLETYKADLCPDSVEYTNAADTPQAFLRILGEFVAHIGMKDIPTIDWARKWFGNEEELTHECGVYIDYVGEIKNYDNEFLFLFGNCKVNFVQKISRFCRIMARDDSYISLFLFCAGSTILRLHGNARHYLIHKDYSHILKVHTI